MTTTKPTPRTGPLRTSGLDKTFGHNIARLRNEACLDQYTLADMLTESSGWAWHQSLLSRIELGTRPVRLAEAYALAAVFGTSVDALTGKSNEASKTQAFAQLAEVRRLQVVLRTRARQITHELETTTPTATMRKHA